MKNTIDKYERNKELEEIAVKVNLFGEDLDKITRFISQPSYEALRLFLSTEQEESPTAQWMANYMYENRQLHECYRNDCFCIAQLFNLDDKKKKESGLWIIENGMAGYFESVTHGKFKLNRLLDQICTPDMPFPLGKSYIALAHHRIREIANALKISNEELANSAEDIIKWCLRGAYKVGGIASTFNGGSYIGISQAEELAEIYLLKERKKGLVHLFQEARTNMKHPDKINPYNIDYKQRR